MIVFESVRYKNLLSSGNVFVEIKLNSSSVTIFTGMNGGGKSSFLDALCLCLFNKGFRDIPKGNFVNAVNGRECLVETTFTNNNKRYLVRRGIKPNIFEIEIDGYLREKDSSDTLQQAYLEKHILGMNWKTFTQIVILGSASHVPFMQLETIDRRAIIEYLLDLAIFSRMKKVLKAKQDILKEELLNTKSEVSTYRTKVELALRYLERTRTDISDKVKKNEVVIEQTKADIKKEYSNLEEYRAQSTALCIDTAKKDKAAIENVITQKRNLISKFEARIDQLTKEIKFFQETDNCPTCKSQISEEVKESSIRSNIDIIEDCNIAKQTVEDELQEKEKELQIIIDKEKLYDEIEQNIVSVKATLVSYDKFLQKVKAENADLLVENSDDVMKQELIDAISGLKTRESLYIELESTQEIYSIATALLKDDGIKSSIVKQFIPVINQTVNKYLQMMDFFVKFQLDENFKEVIKESHINEWRYANFSEGEKKRIDLAILMTWIEVAAKKNSLNCNLLILDELFDGALDGEGVTAFTKIIQAQNKNVFVVTHKTELVDTLTTTNIGSVSHYNFEKKKGFSHIRKLG